MGSKEEAVYKKDASQLYMKEYRESNRNAIRESQKQCYDQKKDVKNLSVRPQCQHNKQAKQLSV